MKIKQTLGALFLLANFIFAPSIFAGGPHFSLEADSYGSTNSDGTYGRIMRFVSQERPCESTQVTFKFVESKDGDYIMTTSGSPTYTFTKDSPPYYQDGLTTCGTTAKMGSKIKGMRQVTVQVKNSSETPIINVDFDGEYHADNSYNGYNYWSSQDSPAYRLNHPQTTPSPDSKPSLWVDQKFLEGIKRQVTLNWYPIPGVVKYNVYAKFADFDNQWGAALAGVGETSATLTLNSYENYYLKVSACISADSCTDSNLFFLGKMTSSPLVSTSPTTITPTPDNRVDELSKKVSDLQNQLVESNKTQNALEQRINDLVNFIKSLFPFFK